MDSLSGDEGILVKDLTRLSTGPRNNKRSSSPVLLYEEESKRPRLDEDDDVSSRESRWSQYRDCTNLSTLTEASDTSQHEQEAHLLEGYNVHLAADQIPDLESHIDKLAMDLEAWSLVNLKEWRHKKAVEEKNMEHEGSSPSVKHIHPKKLTRDKQRAAKRNLMRALRQFDTVEAMQDG